MKISIPISLNRLATKRMAEVKAGQLSREEAEKLLKEKLRHSSKLREDLIEGLAKNYDREAAEAMKYFRLI